MRFHEFCLRIPGDEFRMRFHDRLTVVAGIGAVERDELLTSVIGALSGSLPGTTFTYLNEVGQEVTVEAGSGATAADGTPTATMADLLGANIDEMVRLMRIDGTDLGIRPGESQIDRHPELRDARQALAEVTDALQAAVSAQHAAEAMHHELLEIDERIRKAEETQARREYAKVLARLERVRAEHAVVRGGSQSSGADRLLLKRAPDIHRLTEVFEKAMAELQEAETAFGNGERLSPDELAEAVRYPDAVPAELSGLLRRHAEAKAEVKRLTNVLQERAAARLPDPSSPLVLSLARLPQDELWAANAAFRKSARRAEASRLGLSDDIDIDIDDLVATIEELEANHRELEEALEEAEESKVKRAFAQRRAAEAEKREQELTQRLGVPGYLSFHIRQMELTMDPQARIRVEEAELELRLAAIAWGELAGDVDSDEAAALETEVRSYARALAGLGGEAAELDKVQRRLAEEAQPALADARRGVLDVCARFGVDQIDLAAEMVSHQVEQGRRARLQQRLERALAHEERAASALSDALLDVGFAEGDLGARLGAFRWATERATERTETRQSARPAAEVEADLARLEAEAERLRRPEWASVSASEAEAPDLDELRERRANTAAAHHATASLIPDIERLRDRYKAVSRRVEVLETELRNQGLLSDGATDGVEQYLLARLAAVRGKEGSPTLPVVLDDPFRTLDPERKAELLELCQRLGERVQMIYLTDDPDIARWARRHTNDGTLMLLEPSDESVDA